MIDVNYNSSKKRHSKKINGKRIIYTIVLLSIIILLGQKIYADSIDRVSIVLSDSKLYAKLESVLNSYSNVIYNPTTLTIEFPVNSIPEVKQLDISNAGVTNITGLEKFTALNELNAASNSITSVSNLSSLTNLKKLNLSSNQQFSDVSSLASFTNLEELNLYNTSISSVSPLTSITNLKSLNIGSTSISDITPLHSLQLTDLNLAGNINLRNINEITSMYSLRRLDISGCSSLTDFGDNDSGIYNLTNLVYLNINSSKVSASEISLITKTYSEKENGVTVTKPYLINLQELRADNTVGISFANLSKLTSLKILYMSNCTGSISLSKIYELDNLDEIYLDGNKIKSISDFNYFKTENGVSVLKDQLSATKISLANNQISDISAFSYFSPSQIKYLNLSTNMISNISPIESFSFDGRPQANLNLANQKLTMLVRKKPNSEDQYIILYPIMQSAMNPNSIAYRSGNKFICSECSLNTDSKYNASPYYNVIIKNETMYSNPVPTISVRLNGGVASGTTITYTISTNTASIDSLIFPDPNLASAISRQLKKDNKYYLTAHNIINLETSIITAVTEFDIKSSNISDLSGISNFTNLQILNAANNNFTNISELQFLTKMKQLNLSNNNIGDNNNALTYLKSLTTLSLGNTGMTNLNFLAQLNTDTKNKMPITLLDLQSNQISDITEVGKLPSLTNLNISKNRVTDLSVIANETGLKQLNISSNNISDISTVSSFTGLVSFYCDDNLIKSVEPLSNCSSLGAVSIKGNQITSIEPLRYLTLYTFYCDNNNISDVDPIENMPFTSQSEETPFTAYVQLITMSLDENATGNITVTLPAIFMAAKNPESKVYTTNNFVASNCTLSSDNRSITLNAEDIENKIATVTIKGGYADGTKFTIAPALKGYIAYSTQSLTNKDVKATITFNRPNVTILNNNSLSEYTFTKNGEFTFEYVDENGFTGSSTAKVTWIDKDPPILTYRTETVQDSDNILVTIESNEEINTYPNSWTRASNKLSLTKEFSESTTEDVAVTDNAGNGATIKVKTETGDEILTSETYVVDEENLFVTKVQPKTSVSDFNNGVTSEGSYIVKDSKGNAISGTGYVTTGSKVVFNTGTDTKEYTIVVIGDLNFDGKITVTDLAAVQRIILNATSNPSEEVLKAANVNNDTKITVSDLAGVQRYILSNGTYIFK